DNELAMLGLLCRAAEGVLIASLIPNSQGLLWLASVRAGVDVPDVATTNALGAFLLAPGAAVGAIFFAVGSTIFSYFLLGGADDPRITRVVGRALLSAARHRRAPPGRWLLDRPTGRISVGAGDRIRTRPPRGACDS